MESQTNLRMNVRVDSSFSASLKYVCGTISSPGRPILRNLAFPFLRHFIMKLLAAGVALITGRARERGLNNPLSLSLWLSGFLSRVPWEK